MARRLSTKRCATAISSGPSTAPTPDRCASHFPWPCSAQVGEGDVISVGQVQVRVLETPCHTPGHVCFVIDPVVGGDAGHVFTGDTYVVQRPPPQCRLFDRRC